MKKLNEYRAKIDKIDRKIVEFLNERANVATQIGALKSKTGMKVYDPAREAKVIAKLLKLNRLIPDASLKAIYSEIISASRSLEDLPNVAYLGPEGTFSHSAALSLFGSSCNFIPCGGFESVFDIVEKGIADFGILPIENSIEGSVNISLDLLAESTLNIIAEKTISAHQHLITDCVEIGDIKKLYSHPQPLGQCRKFLAKNLPGVKVIETSSTAMAAQKAAKDKNSAAIASETAAKIYGLKILKRRIQDYPNNVTRFMALSKKHAPRAPKCNYKTSTALTLKNKPGALYNLLGVFEKRKINLTKIVSRPLPKSAWTYLFYIDFEGHRNDKKVEALLKEAARLTEEIKILGSYPVGA